MTETKLWQRLRLVVPVVALGMFLTACAGSLPASVSGGECKIFAPPDYAIRGKTQKDQDWIDDTEESGIAGCKWSRPKARPIVKASVTSPPIKSNAIAPAPVKKHWWQRLHIKKPTP